jgi:hypothetical protein
MSRGPATYRKSDLKRGIKALESAGLKVARVEIQSDKIVLIPDNGATTVDADPQPHDLLDNWMAKRAHSIEGH